MQPFVKFHRKTIDLDFMTTFRPGKDTTPIVPKLIFVENGVHVHEYNASLVVWWCDGALLFVFLLSHNHFHGRDDSNEGARGAGSVIRVVERVQVRVHERGAL